MQDMINWKVRSHQSLVSASWAVETAQLKADKRRTNELPHKKQSSPFLTPGLNMDSDARMQVAGKAGNTDDVIVAQRIDVSHKN